MQLHPLLIKERPQMMAQHTRKITTTIAFSFVYRNPTKTVDAQHSGKIDHCNFTCCRKKKALLEHLAREQTKLTFSKNSEQTLTLVRFWTVCRSLLYCVNAADPEASTGINTIMKGNLDRAAASKGDFQEHDLS